MGKHESISGGSKHGKEIQGSAVYGVRSEESGCGEASRIEREGVNPMEDGLYVSVFAIKNGIRYDCKTMEMKDVTKTMVDSMMDGLLGNKKDRNEEKLDG